MKFKIRKDKRIREKFLRQEKRIKVLKALYNNMYLDGSLREIYKQNLMKTKGIEFKIKNRCIFTGRSYSVLRDFKISRIQFKDLVAKGLLVGVRKASW